MTTFGDRLRRLRGERKLTMKDLGERVGLTESAIGMIERGVRNPSFEKLQELADFFEVDLNYLIGKADASMRQPVNPNELARSKVYLFDIAGFRSDDDFIECLDNQSLIDLANAHRSRSKRNPVKKNLDNLIEIIKDDQEIALAVFENKHIFKIVERCMYLDDKELEDILIYIETIKKSKL